MMNEASSLSKLCGSEKFIKDKPYVQNRRQNYFSSSLFFQFLSKASSVIV